MVFSSNIFLFLFLPSFLAAYYLVPNRARARNVVVLAGSYLFYAWWRIDFLALFAAVTVWNYFIGLAIARHGVRSRRSRHWLALGVGVDLAVLGYFKYANFGVDCFNDLLHAFGAEPFAATRVILPIGISFYIFESISYIMDVYRGDAEPTRHPVDFATFVALFPHLIAGPIFRYKDLADQFSEREHSVELFARGTRRLMTGLIKKVFIADSIAPIVDHVFALQHPLQGDAWLGAIAYTIQLYFDFSGYSDMAVGLGLMMGFRFVENFRSPYLSQSITEFWRRWHISLSNWLRDYLYIPLGGNRGTTLETYRNLFLTMLLGGLWHGANWTFLLWGAWHGALLSVERVAGVSPVPQGFRPWRWALTLLLVVLGWVLFRAAHVADALRLYESMFRVSDGFALGQALADQLTRMQLLMLAFGIAGIAAEWLREHRAPRLDRLRLPAIAWEYGVLAPMFVLAVLKLSAQSFSPFLYFQF